MSSKDLHSSAARVPELDLLRGLAIFLVLGRHLLSLPETGGGVLGAFFRAWRNMGWMGVDLFFVLSGYLVGGLLIREGLSRGSINAYSFLTRRGLRIYPAFYVLLIATVVLKHVIGLQFPTWPTGLYHEIFFIQNYLPGLWPQTWSLAVEEHFYVLLLCLTLALVSRSKKGKDPFGVLPKLVLGLNTAILCGRVLMGYVAHAHWSILLIQTHWRLDSLLFGVLLYYTVRQHKQRLTLLLQKMAPWRGIGLGLLLVPCMILNINRDAYIPTFGTTALYLGFGWVLLALLFAETTKKSWLLRSLPFLPFVGRYSYSIYLWHVAVFYIEGAYIHRKLHLNPPFALEAVGCITTAILFGIAMTWLVEKPFLIWRERLAPSETRALEEITAVSPRDAAPSA